MINKTFKDYELSDVIVEAVTRLGYKEPTKVQQAVIPVALKDKDMVVKSKTGSGKTAAFAIPICEKVDWEENAPQALVLAPTRELALQIQEDFFNIGRLKRLKVVALYGKAPFMAQQKALKQKTHVVVGTPGRVIDHLERGTWSTGEIRYVVIDEADEMLKMGFVEQIHTIMTYLQQKHTTLLFSATMPQDIAQLCDRLMTDPEHIAIESPSLANTKVEATLLETLEADKLAYLHRLIVKENPDSCMIFANTKVQVDTIHEGMEALGIRCRKIHGGMEQRDRQQVMEDFKKGKFRYLIATDVAARGIDVDHVTYVVNYDLPEDKENYVHRIGRTGRAGRIGKAISFVTPRDRMFLKAIETYIGYQLPYVNWELEGVDDAAHQAFQEKMVTPVAIVQKNEAPDIMKMHINAGKKTKMRPVDIVGTLCNIEGVTADDIGIINVLDVSTFVEVLNHKGPMVLKALQNKPIKGRIRRVTKADQPQ